MCGDDGGPALAELLERVVAGEQGAGVNAAVMRRLDIVLHVANVQRLILEQVVFTDDFVDFLTFIPDAEIKFFKAVVHPGIAGLHGVVLGVDRAENEAADFLGFAEIKEVVRMGQGDHFAAHFPEAAVKPAFERVEGDVRREPPIEPGERQLELTAEFVQRERRDTGLLEDMVGRLPDAGQVVHQRARPVENDIPNHAPAV